MLSVEELVRSFVDIVSKNGNLLLNVGPKPDGTISVPQLARLRALGRWLDVNGEAIFGTRPWGDAEGILRSDPTGVRFTHKSNTVYAILLGTPAEHTITLEDDATTVHLLGREAPLHWHRDNVAVQVELPDGLPDSPAHTLKISPQPGYVMKK
jgi:alpha-L-fucosidase